jgi:hypothetical protein
VTVTPELWQALCAAAESVGVEPWAARDVFDLLVTGGLGPTGPAGSPALADVAIAEGRIAEVAAGLDRAAAREVVDASGCYVLYGAGGRPRPRLRPVREAGRLPDARARRRDGGADLAGDAADLQETLPVSGCGLTVGALRADSR